MKNKVFRHAAFDRRAFGGLQYRRGRGQDIQRGGEKIEDAAKK